MFTIKLYSGDGFRQLILSAESFTILRGGKPEPGTSGAPADINQAEITLHQKNQSDDRRIDIGDDTKPCDPGRPQRFNKAIIENAAGRTTEIIAYSLR